MSAPRLPSLLERILDVLRGQGDLSLQDLVGLLPGYDRIDVDPTLTQLMRQAKVTLHRGRYSLTEHGRKNPTPSEPRSGAAVPVVSPRKPSSAPSSVARVPAEPSAEGSERATVGADKPSLGAAEEASANLLVDPPRTCVDCNGNFTTATFPKNRHGPMRRVLMDDKIKPIPTWYRGRRFRSKAEVSWAKRFDEFCLKWRYETEGYTFCVGEQNTRIFYLPDFWLPTLNTFAEVKGGINQWDIAAEIKAAGLVKHSGRPLLICTDEGADELDLPVLVPDPTLPWSYEVYRCDLRESIVRGFLWLEKRHVVSAA